MLNKIKNDPIITIAIIVCFIFGISFIFSNPEVIKYLISSIIGITIIIMAVIKLLSLKTLNQLETKTMIFPILAIVAGILVITSLNLLLIICGVYLLVEPITKIIQSNNKKERLKYESPRLIMAVLLILLSINIIAEILFKIVGISLIASSIYLTYCLLTNKKINRKSGYDDIIDVEE